MQRLIAEEQERMYGLSIESVKARVQSMIFNSKSGLSLIKTIEACLLDVGVSKADITLLYSSGPKMTSITARSLAALYVEEAKGAVRDGKVQVLKNKLCAVIMLSGPMGYVCVPAPPQEPQVATPIVGTPVHSDGSGQLKRRRLKIVDSSFLQEAEVANAATEANVEEID